MGRERGAGYGNAKGGSESRRKHLRREGTREEESNWRRLVHMPTEARGEEEEPHSLLLDFSLSTGRRGRELLGFPWRPLPERACGYPGHGMLARIFKVQIRPLGAPDIQRSNTVPFPDSHGADSQIRLMQSALFLALSSCQQQPFSPRKKAREKTKKRGISWRTEVCGYQFRVRGKGLQWVGSIMVYHVAEGFSPSPPTKWANGQQKTKTSPPSTTRSAAEGKDCS